MAAGGSSEESEGAEGGEPGGAGFRDEAEALAVFPADEVVVAPGSASGGGEADVGGVLAEEAYEINGGGDLGGGFGGLI